MGTNYIKQIEGHEAVLDKYVEALFAGTCRAAKKYPNPLQLPGYENCWENPLVTYFLQKQPFDLVRAKEFVEKLRRVTANGFNDIYYPLDRWVEMQIQLPFFENKGTKWQPDWVRKAAADAGSLNPDYIRFMCFLAVSHLKYGPSYASVTANLYFGMATALGSGEVAKLKQHGSGTLPQELTHYQDDAVSCVANDAFATIKITIRQEAAASYRRVLEFLNALLLTDFPRSYSIEFSSKEKTYLPIKGLPKVAVNALFANAVRHESLHLLVAEYVRRAARPHEWYNNLEGEACAKPGTFAVFALGLVGEAYFGLVIDYLREVDEEHQEIQTRFTVALVEKYGITEQSFPVFMYCLLSTQSHKQYKVFAEQFSTRPRLEMLLACKHNFASYLPEESRAESGPEILVEVDAEPQELPVYLWQDVLRAIFNSATLTPKFIKSVPEDLRPLYVELFA